MGLVLHGDDRTLERTEELPLRVPTPVGDPWEEPTAPWVPVEPSPPQPVFPALRGERVSRKTGLRRRWRWWAAADHWSGDGGAVRGGADPAGLGVAALTIAAVRPTIAAVVPGTWPGKAGPDLALGALGC